VTRPIPANHGCDAPPPRPQPAPGQRPGFSSLAVPHGGRAHCASSCWSQPALDPTARHASSHRGFRQLCEDSDNCGARAPDACRVCRRSLRSRCGWLPRCALPELFEEPVPSARREDHEEFARLVCRPAQVVVINRMPAKHLRHPDRRPEASRCVRPRRPLHLGNLRRTLRIRCATLPNCCHGPPREEAGHLHKGWICSTFSVRPSGLEPPRTKWSTRPST
jgi:hypothetical protein